MIIYNLYILNKVGTLLYYGEWRRSNYSGLAIEEEAKIMFGIISSIKAMKLYTSVVDSRGSFVTYKTPKYTIHCLETPSGVNFILNTDDTRQDVRALLNKIHEDIYVMFAPKNTELTGKRIINRRFKTKLNSLIKIESIKAGNMERTLLYRNIPL